MKGSKNLYTMIGGQLLQNITWYVSKWAKIFKVSWWLCNIFLLTFASSQNEDTQIHLQRPDRDLEMERLSCVYDNDFLEEMQRSARSQHYQNSETLLQSKNETEPPDEVLPQKILISSLKHMKSHYMYQNGSWCRSWHI